MIRLETRPLLHVSGICLEWEDNDQRRDLAPKCQNSLPKGKKRKEIIHDHLHT